MIVRRAAAKKLNRRTAGFRPRAINAANVRYVTADIIECPLGKLKFDIVVKCGTMSGRGRATRAFNTVLNHVPDRIVATRKYAACRFDMRHR